MLTTAMDYYPARTKTFVVPVGTVLDIRFVDHKRGIIFISKIFSNPNEFFINIDLEYRIIFEYACISNMI